MNETEKHTFFLEPWRMWILYGAIALLFGYYAYRLFSYQVIDGKEYLAYADENRTTKISEPTQRGIIYDRNGIVLARNVASYNVTVTPAKLPGTLPLTYEEPVPGPIQDVYRRLSNLIGIPVSAGTINDETVRLFKPCETDMGIREVVYIQDSTAPYDSVSIKCNIPEDLAMRIREMSADIPGVNIEVQPVRDYPTGELTAELIGFIGPIPANQPGIMLEDYYREKGFVPGRDKVGYAGIENSLQDVLGGRNGERLAEVDVAGQEIRNVVEPVDPVPGNNIRLTIDVRLQMAAREALTNEMNYWNTLYGDLRPEKHMRSGVVIAMNPKTGEVLAMVSYPSYENNRFARLIPSYYYNQLSIDPAKPLLNKAVSGEFPPGSVFKMPTAIGALNERVIAPDYEVDDPGKIIIEEKPLPNSPSTKNREYVCWDRNGHGQVNWIKGVEQSCDVYFYKIGGGYKDQVPNGGLGIWRLGEYARALGYGAVTGIELPGEQTGLIPDPNWKRQNQGESWTTGDTYIASMGQGLILATPLQVLMSAVTIANDGKQMKPTLIHDILDSEGNIIKPFEPTLHWDVTKDPVIHVYDENSIQTGEMKKIEPWVIQMAKQALRGVVTEGTAQRPITEEIALDSMGILSAGKTGTAEYCDDIANKANRCNPGSWPAHAWYFGYAPYDNPEIAVVSFVYNGDEGSSVSAPIVGKVIEAYYNLKAIDQDKGGEGTTP
jgi:penicillin-binding protein 2